MIAGVPAVQRAAHAAVLRGAAQRMDRRRGAGDGLEIGAANAAPTRRRGGAAIRASGCGQFGLRFSSNRLRPLKKTAGRFFLRNIARLRGGKMGPEKSARR
jgi:hypothetical protein